MEASSADGLAAPVTSLTPAATCSRRPATRTWKNSSRFEATMATNLTRSSRGTLGFSAMASTLSWKSRRDNSRLV